MDRIFLRGMTFAAAHGVLPHEKGVRQRFIVDAELLLDLRAAGVHDSLAETVNYAEVYEIVRKTIEGETKKLIESLAEDIADRVLAAFSMIRSARITVHKPAAPIPGIFSDVGVSITREREEQ